MFSIGDYVVFGTDGVCEVESVGPLDIQGMSPDKLYYTLKPCAKSGNSRIFAPVDGKRVVIRRALSREEATGLIARLKEIPMINIIDERKREEQYKQILLSCDCESIIGLLKGISSRMRLRAAAGKKLPSVDERYYNMAENALYNEMCMSLESTKEEIMERVRELLGRTNE